MVAILYGDTDVIRDRPEPVYLAPRGVLRGFPAAANRRTPQRKPLGGIVPNQ